MIKVLELLTGAPKFDGPTVSALRYARAMDRTRIQVDFAASSPPPDAISEQISSLGGTFHLLPSRLRTPHLYIPALKRLTRSEGYDIVRVHGNSCTMALDLLAAKLGGVKVRVPYSLNSSCRYQAAHRMLRPLFDRLYTDAWACGEEAGKWLYRDRPFRVARIAVETSRYRFDREARLQVRKELALGDGIVLGSVANFNVQKNHLFLLDCFARFRKINPASVLVLVGDGSEKGVIQKKIAEEGLSDSVRLLGSRQDVPRLIQGFDVMLLPSLYEGFPNVLVEWQCAGLRSLVSDTVTRRAALTPLVEFLPISEGAKPWAEALSRFVPPENREEVSQKAVSEIISKGYDISAGAAELEAFYLKSVQRSKET